MRYLCILARGKKATRKIWVNLGRERNKVITVYISKSGAERDKQEYKTPVRDSGVRSYREKHNGRLL